MPTIEIASIDSTGLLLKQSDFEVAIIEEDRLESHRGLFYDFLWQQKGTIVHIGNPAFKNDKEGGYFAGAIIDWSLGPPEVFIPNFEEGQIDSLGANQQFRFRFLHQYKFDINRLLKAALDKSPISRVCFLTDYQFGPEKERIEIIFTISDFWSQHDSEGLDFNTMYEIYGH